ncbi:MAG: insulinase family protein [Peptostreptococcaceae bacterium]|nr:insulinase family protein [Peptostreptococcaceae bacterium]
MIKKIKLESGIELIMDKFDSVSSVSIGVWSKTGAVNETEGINGISHYIEHMLFKGTTNRTSMQLVSEVDSVGGQMNAFTGKEGTCFYIKCLNTNLFKCADVLVDMIENPLFDELEMEREKQVVCEEIKMNFDDPTDLILDVTDEFVFGDSNLGNSVLGTEETVKSITPEALRSYFDNQYTKDSVFISIAGSFDEERVIEYFNTKFNNLLETKQQPSDRVYLHKPQTKYLEKDIKQAHICLAKEGLSVKDKDHYALAILSNLFGGSMSSRLFQNIREIRGLAYSVYSSASYYKESGYFKIYAGVGKDKIDEALEGIKEEMDKLKTGEITKEEIDSAREQLKSGYMFSLETVQGRMIVNGRSNLQLGMILGQQEIIDRLNNVSHEDIVNVSKLIYDISDYSLAVVKGR